MADITVVLGPVECRSCGGRVVWGSARIRGNSGRLNRWRDPITGQQHKCKGARLA